MLQVFRFPCVAHLAFRHAPMQILQGEATSSTISTFATEAPVLRELASLVPSQLNEQRIDDTKGIE